MGSIQPHIRCSREDSAEYAILPGDPGRVDRIKSFLENAAEIAFNREYKTVTGYYRGVKVMVTSTGIGGPSTGIAIEELNNIGVKTLIRIGSCGALQTGMKLGDLVIATGAVRNEGTSDAYIERGYPAIAHHDVLFSIIRAAESLGYTHHCGRVRSHDSFYTYREEEIDGYWSGKGVLGADMETSPLFVIGGLRGLRTGSILNVVVEYNSELEAGINEYVNGEEAAAEGEKREILTALEAIVYLEAMKRNDIK